MQSQVQKTIGIAVSAALISGVLSILPMHSASAQGSKDASKSSVTDAELNRWHETLKDYSPIGAGCFHTSYPSLNWEKVPCGPKPTTLPIHPRLTPPSVEAPKDGFAATAQTSTSASQPNYVGNTVDYVAQTSGTTWYAVGTFGMTTNLTSVQSLATQYGNDGILGPGKYMLQLNSQIAPYAATCSQYGYTSCKVWQQFFYIIGGTHKDGATDATTIYMQYWLFPSTTDYNLHKCPKGWNDNTGSCYLNSSAMTVPALAITELRNMKLSGAIGSGSQNIVRFSHSTDTWAVSASDSVLHLGSWWKQTEFNVFGDLDYADAVFNTGASITVNLSAQDYTTNPDICLGPSKGTGFTGEYNSMTLGSSCQAGGGSTPSITFTESD